MKFRKASLALSLATAGLLIAACSSNSASTTTTTTTTTTPTATTTASKTIVQIAADNPDFTTLVAAVKAAGLAGTLSGPAHSRSSPRQTLRLPHCRLAR